MVIYAERQPAQTHACILPHNGVWHELEGGLARVRALVGYAKPSSVVVSLALLDLEHSWSGAANNWWSGLLNNQT